MVNPSNVNKSNDIYSPLPPRIEGPKAEPGKLEGHPVKELPKPLEPNSPPEHTDKVWEDTILEVLSLLDESKVDIQTNHQVTVEDNDPEEQALQELDLALSQLPESPKSQPVSQPSEERPKAGPLPFDPSHNWRPPSERAPNPQQGSSGSNYINLPNPDQRKQTVDPKSHYHRLPDSFPAQSQPVSQPSEERPKAGPLPFDPTHSWRPPSEKLTPSPAPSNPQSEYVNLRDFAPKAQKGSEEMNLGSLDDLLQDIEKEKSHQAGGENQPLQPKTPETPLQRPSNESPYVNLSQSRKPAEPPPQAKSQEALGTDPSPSESQSVDSKSAFQKLAHEFEMLDQDIQAQAPASAQSSENVKQTKDSFDTAAEEVYKDLSGFSTKKLLEHANLYIGKMDSLHPKVLAEVRRAVNERLEEKNTKKTELKRSPLGRMKLAAKNLAQNRLGHGTHRKQLRAANEALETHETSFASNVFYRETAKVKDAYNSINPDQKASFFKIFKSITSNLNAQRLPGGDVIDPLAKDGHFDIEAFLDNVRNPKVCGVSDNLSVPKGSFIHTPTLIAFKNAITQSIDQSKHDGQELSGFDALLKEVDSLIKSANKIQAQQLEASYSPRLEAGLSSIDQEQLKNVSLDGQSVKTEWQVKNSAEHNKQQDLVAAHQELNGVFQGHVQGKSELKEGEFSGDGAQIFQRGNVYASAVVDAAGNTENSAKATAEVLKIIENEMQHLPTPPTPEKLQAFFMNIIQQGHLACKNLDRECTLSFNLYLPMENGNTMLVGFSLGDTFNVIRRADGKTEVLTPDPPEKKETANGGGLGNVTRFGEDREFDVYVIELNPGDEVGQMSDFGRDNFGYIQDQLADDTPLMDAALNVREPPKNAELEKKLEEAKEKIKHFNGGEEFRKLNKEIRDLTDQLNHPTHPTTGKDHKRDDSAVVIFKSPSKTQSKAMNSDSPNDDETY